MNRRHLTVIAVVLAVGLFVAPLISPVPEYGPHLRVHANDEPMNVSTETGGESQLRSGQTLRYGNLSSAAQQLIDEGHTAERFGDEPTVPLGEAPESFASLAPEDGAYSAVYVQKDGQYYAVELRQYTPSPSLLEFLLRIGSLFGAIALGTLAGYFTLTRED